MRTTLDLPDELLKRAKVAAIERGSTLRQLVSDALTRDLMGDRSPAEPLRRVQFPIFSSKSPGKLKLTSRDISEMDLDEDSRRHGIPR